MASGDIDPSVIEWRSRRYVRGRSTPITIAFPSRRGVRVTATFRAKPTSALAAIAQLQNHAHPGHIAGAPLFSILHDIAQQRRNGKRCYARQTAGVKVSTTPMGAQTLLCDLKFWTSRTNPTEIRSSVVVHVLLAAANAKTTRWRATREAVDALLTLDGPWISAFARRQNAKHISATDLHLRDKILAAAKRAGYKRAEFFRRCKPGIVLLWPIQAFLIEYCLGGAHWWRKANLIPPMQLMRQAVQRGRGSTETGKRTIYRHYLGDGWRAIIERQPELGYVPRRIRRL